MRLGRRVRSDLEQSGEEEEASRSDARQEHERPQKVRQESEIWSGVKKRRKFHLEAMQGRTGSQGQMARSEDILRDDAFGHRLEVGLLQTPRQPGHRKGQSLCPKLPPSGLCHFKCQPRSTRSPHSPSTSAFE